MKDVAAERVVLAGVCQHGGEAYADVADLVRAETFTDEGSRAIFRCQEHALKDRPDGRVDYGTIMASAQSLGLHDFLSRPDEQKFLRAVINLPPVELQNVRRLAAKVSKLEIARRLSDAHDEAKSRLLQATGDEPIDQILAMAENPVFDLTTKLAGSNGQQTVLLGANAEAYYAHLMDHPTEAVGIPTGFPRFDRSLGGGLLPGCVDFVVARAKEGKSVFGDNVCLNVAGRVGVPVLNLDTEMTDEEHLWRVGAALTGIPIWDIRRGKCGSDPALRERLLEAGRRLKDMPYSYRSIIGEAFEDVLAHARRWVIRHVGLGDNGKAKPCVIVYDYLKLVSADGLGNHMHEHQKLGFVATALKNFVGRYGVSCLCFGQMNREGLTHEDERAVAGSDRLTWFSTSLSFFKEKPPEDHAEDPDGAEYTHKIVPWLSRHGEGLPKGDYVNIKFEKPLARMTEGPTRFELAAGAGNPPRGFVIADDAEEVAV